MSQEQFSDILDLLRRPKPRDVDLIPLFVQLEHDYPCNVENQIDDLTGVWELRWSSSNAPYLQVQPWFENLQILLPTDKRAVNLLKLPAPLGGIAVVAALQIQPPKRIGITFIRGGWIGPKLSLFKPKLITNIKQEFPAWLDVTVLTNELRLSRGSNGTLFALIKRHDLNTSELTSPLSL
ncbi:MAG: PAP fibrillin [Synechococcaceae bacterium WBA_2_066]|nr:PAP fibrillin [Synechococcaceae bacterium WB6_1A_059]NBQ19594.1 PAP fibrillin [Synechococcaceae bacterium WB5_2A_257]NBR45106.1 PAP fibrillin [Synechococcaceae bacterium WB5_2B_268]NBY58737.1 PAP fibrillin [Synechococcaceae bacterium LLD_019]NCU90887.1 PAP fibrillin [Synechococcaceae bacterium WB7_1B_046]NCY13337.1 PAP fibrillin [Synechococcaceae bacterium WB8_1A_041]NDC06585.1 PAP fibrillin [Synechococcaceae bacterium WB9_2_069]NDE37955.1 PAP fibrillin [Synechococcaceae bacterium WBA_2_0